jgi:P-type Ca2+ transporter type 2C
MTMTFAVMGLGTVFNALVNRRDPTSGLTAPIVKALAIALVPLGLVFLATQLPSLQGALLTVPLTGGQWLVCLGLAALLPLTVEAGKVVRRRRRQPPAPLDPAVVVSPARAVRHRRASPTP